jgi:hypothetical protein
MQPNFTQEIVNSKHPVKKEWLKPDVEIISHVVESGISFGIEGTVFPVPNHGSIYIKYNS